MKPSKRNEPLPERQNKKLNVSDRPGTMIGSPNRGKVLHARKSDKLLFFNLLPLHLFLAGHKSSSFHFNLAKNG